MSFDTIRSALNSGDSAAMESALDDEAIVFWVDWREEDDAIVEYCESVLNTGKLSAEIVDVDNDAGFDMYITYGDLRQRVPLVIDTADRHITLCTLNEMLAPDFEIRYCVASEGSDTATCLPLTTENWRQLEAEFGDTLAKHFRRMKINDNPFG